MAMPISTQNSEQREESEPSDDEGEEGYQMGGYHFVRIGDTFKDNRYVVQSKLGWGHFSTVWLAWDTHENKYVALKVQKSAPHYTAAAQDEALILDQIRSGDPEDKKCIVTMLDYFEHSGPNGNHVCIVLEYLGDNLLSLIKYYSYRGMPLKMVKNICYYTLIGLDYLHRECSIIHTDLKPENVVLVSVIDSSQDPRKNGKPLIPPPQNCNTTRKPLNSAALKETALPSKSAQPKQPLISADPSKSAQPKQLLISAAPKATVSISTVCLTKNQKKRLKKKAKKIALAISKKESVTDIQEPKDNTAECSRTEVPADSGVKKEDDVEEVKPLKKEDNVETVVPLKRMRLDVRRKILASIDLRCKIVDFGNSCWTYKHFTDNIQTRQYRAPEVIIGAPYSTPADMWSFACMAFELATGDVLFDPQSGDVISKEEDHLALMLELLGVMPKKIALGGRHSRNFFNRAGQLKSIRKLCFCSLSRVLITKYHFNEQVANEFADFLVPILDFVPEKRPTAAECLLHPWLNSESHAPEPCVQDHNENDVQSPETSEQVSDEKPPVLVNVLSGNSSIGGWLPNSSMQANEASGKITIEASQSDQGQSRTWTAVVRGGK